MPDRKALILSRMQAESQKAMDYLRSLGPADWEQQVYTTGGLWRVRDVLGHFVSAERTFVEYGRQILDGGDGVPEDFRIDEFNESQVAGMAGREPEDLMAEFAARRAATLQLVQSMQDADLDRVGRHPWFGRVPLEEMTKLVYRHTMLHLRDVRRALETGGPVPHMNASPPGLL